MAAVAREDHSAIPVRDARLERVLLRSSTLGNKPSVAQVSVPRRLQRSSSHGLLRRHPNLQLPSFEQLGISAHRPNLSGFDQIPQYQLRPLSANPPQRRTTHRSEPLVLTSSFLNLSGAPLLTPPDDVDSIKWNCAVGQESSVSSASKGTQLSNEDPRGSVLSLTTDPNELSTSQEAQPTRFADQTQDSLGSHATREGAPSGSGGEPKDVLEQGIGTNVSTVTTPDARMNGVTVISQTLPHPIQDSNPHSVFTPMVEAIQSRFEGREGHRPPYIRITHAVPPQFSLRNLPSSPPGTPSGQTEEDYFSLNIFSNAAPVRTYHLYDGTVDRSAPPSPAPIVPPSSVQVAFVERYIPPSTIEEHAAFFSPQGPSVLIDRLFELSASGGSLMLIYPTKSGGQTFRSDHVGPLLDKFLRTMVVVNDMSSDLASSLGRMPAINEMLNFDEMRGKVSNLCKHLSRPKSSASPSSEYSLVYSDVAEVPLDRSTWSEWFLQQETPRIKAALKSYWQRGQKLPTSKETVIPATLLRDIKNCVEEGKYDEGDPTSRIEIGVFVIRRTR